MSAASRSTSIQTTNATALEGLCSRETPMVVKEEETLFFLLRRFDSAQTVTVWWTELSRWLCLVQPRPSNLLLLPGSGCDARPSTNWPSQVCTTGGRGMMCALVFKCKNKEYEFWRAFQPLELQQGSIDMTMVAVLRPTMCHAVVRKHQHAS